MSSSTVSLVLDHSALKRLIGDDPAFEVAVKSAALANIARQRVKLAHSDEVAAFLKDKHSFDEHLAKEFKKLLAEKAYWNDNPQLSPENQALVKNAVKKEFDTLIAEELRKLHEEFWTAWQTKVDELNKDIKTRLNQYLERNSSPAAIEGFILAAAKAKLAGK